MKKLFSFITVCVFSAVISTSVVMDVPMDAGFLCTKPAMLNAAIKARPCRKYNDQHTFIHIQDKCRLVLRTVTASLILNP
jgi:hypothetical protein